VSRAEHVVCAMHHETQMASLLLFDMLGTPLLAGWTTVLAAAEIVRPVRQAPLPRRLRWWQNLRLGTTAAAVERLLVIPSLLTVTRAVERQGWGISTMLPRGVARNAAAFLMLDLGMYGWHRWSHRLPFFWRFHRVHHTDLGLDLTTAVRLHPAELMMSVAIRGVQVALIGPSPTVALLYELAMQAAAMFHHSNVDLTSWGDGTIGHLFMTPKLHERHHAATAEERDCNWGIVLSMWDRLFGSYERAPARDPRLGVEQTRDREPSRVRELLVAPFSPSRPHG
jgi:sterol desaturase/sphingolipid hydroxylase (fatty acid hydroxylase superfamily)